MNGTRAKIWSRRHADHRKQIRAAEAAHAREVATRRRRIVVRVLASIVGVAVFIVAGVEATGQHNAAVIAMSAVSGLIVVGSVFTHAWLRRRIGATTAVLLMSLAGGALFLLLAATASQCPDSAATGRCTGGELANWSLVGMLLPLTGAVMVGAPVVITRVFGRAIGFLVRLWRGNPQD